MAHEIISPENQPQFSQMDPKRFQQVATEFKFFFYSMEFSTD